MPRVGITGATGFVGGALVPYLVDHGHDPVLVDNHSGPVRVDYQRWPAMIDDFASERARRALTDCDVVLHLGAASGVMVCARDPSGTAQTNVEGTRALVTSCAERKVPVAFASSFSVVGSPDQLPVTEKTPPRPTHEYARQKSDGERLITELSRSGAAPSAVLRMSNIYGSYLAEGRTIAKANVLNLFLEQARSGRLQVNAPGSQRRDFIHLSDVLAHWEAAVQWLLHPPAPAASATFCVASGESLSILEVAEKVRKQYASRYPGRALPAVDVVPNPRGGIELVDPEFTVDRSWTERALGVKCGHHVEDYLWQALSSIS
jgi:UDP-glucose 4-epimerase